MYVELSLCPLDVLLYTLGVSVVLAKSYKNTFFFIWDKNQNFFTESRESDHFNLVPVKDVTL